MAFSSDMFTTSRLINPTKNVLLFTMVDRAREIQKIHRGLSGGGHSTACELLCQSIQLSNSLLFALNVRCQIGKNSLEGVQLDRSTNHRRNGSF
jgi:hypothetical protein